MVGWWPWVSRGRYEEAKTAHDREVEALRGQVAHLWERLDRMTDAFERVKRREMGMRESPNGERAPRHDPSEIPMSIRMYARGFKTKYSRNEILGLAMKRHHEEGMSWPEVEESILGTAVSPAPEGGEDDG